MDLKYKLTTAPATFPTDILKLKANLHILAGNTDQEEYLTDLLSVAIDDAQTMTGRQFARATYTAYLDDYPPGDEIEITLGPVAAIISVKYYAPGSISLTIVDASKYQLDNIELTARLRFKESFTIDTDRMNAIEIEFTNGWATAAEIPQTIKDAIILLATERYLNPENQNLSFGFGLKTRVSEKLLSKWKVQRF